MKMQSTHYRLRILKVTPGLILIPIYWIWSVCEITTGKIFNTHPVLTEKREIQEHLPRQAFRTFCWRIHSFVTIGKLSSIIILETPCLLNKLLLWSITILISRLPLQLLLPNINQQLLANQIRELNSAMEWCNRYTVVLHWHTLNAHSLNSFIVPFSTHVIIMKFADKD